MALSKEIIGSLQELAKEIRKENKIKNSIIRDDILRILQDQCVVFYYPLEGEDIEGFHVERFINGKNESIVYINSAKSLEKQVFVAAHELGHVWNVDQRLRSKINNNDFDVETVINRFAAELLIPEEVFKEVVEDELREMNFNGSTISKRELIKLIAYLMDCFLVTFKSIVYRLNEVGRLKDQFVSTIIETYNESELLKTFIEEGQYTRLYRKTGDIGIDNLREDLIELEEQKLFSEKKIKRLREEFKIEAVVEKECAASGEDINFS